LVCSDVSLAFIELCSVLSALIARGCTKTVHIGYRPSSSFGVIGQCQHLFQRGAAPLLVKNVGFVNAGEMLASSHQL
jgi:hypothetical protein